MAAPGILDSDDADRLAHLLWEVGAHAAILSEAALAATPLTPALSGVLDTVAAAPGISIAEMARRLPTSAQNVSQLVARLEKLGFVERRLGERGYGVALFVTDTGERAQREADARKTAFAAELAVALGQPHHDELVRLLKHARLVFAELTAERRGASRANS